MDRILDILLELHPDVDFDTNDHLIDDGTLDSFDIVTIAAEVDLDFGVVIPAEALTPENFNSVKAIYALVERLVRE